MVHGLAVLYARWFQSGGDVEKTEAGLSGNVEKDLEYFVAELDKGKGRFLFGDAPQAADISMHFSVSFILARQLGTKNKSFARVEQFIQDCQAAESYKKAVQKTGYQL